MELWISDYVNFMLQNVKEHKYSWHECFMMHWTNTEERKINHVTILQSKNVYVAASRWLQSWYNVTSSATWNSCRATKWQKIVDLPSFQLVVQHHLNACGMLYFIVWQGTTYQSMTLKLYNAISNETKKLMSCDKKTEIVDLPCISVCRVTSFECFLRIHLSMWQGTNWVWCQDHVLYHILIIARANTFQYIHYIGIS